MPKTASFVPSFGLYHHEGETIAAIATPAGEGGVAIVRMSGKRALLVAERIFSKPIASLASHTLTYGKILDEHRRVIDTVLLAVMRAPRSFTGEDTVEIQCHGGSLITKKVLQAVLHAGARAALPGEFSFKAFKNKKIDLAQAEAIQALIGAKNERALSAAKEQLEGSLSLKISSFQKGLIDAGAFLEAWVDFPEEGLEEPETEKLKSALSHLLNEMERLHESFSHGKLLHTGVTLCLTGAPNVGKSSLMNALLCKERAIVTEIPGTTRDLLEEEMRLEELHFRLIDTAGIRFSSETIEKEGIRRSLLAMERADLILFVLDASRLPTSEERALLQETPKEKSLLIWNKIDLPHPSPLPALREESLSLSAKTEEGLSALKSAIVAKVLKKGLASKEEVVLSNLRHQTALSHAIDGVNALICGLNEQLSPEFLASDLRFALTSLGSIIGIDIGEELLTAVFSKFCIGK